MRNQGIPGHTWRWNIPLRKWNCPEDIAEAVSQRKKFSEREEDALDRSYSSIVIYQNIHPSLSCTYVRLPDQFYNVVSCLLSELIEIQHSTPDLRLFTNGVAAVD